MDPELQKIVASAAAALVGSMTTDGWRWAKGSFAALCGRNRPEAVAELTEELEADQRRLLDARHSGDQQAEAGVRTYWDARLQRLVERHPDAVGELRELLRELGPVAPQQAATFTTVTRDNSRAYINTGTMNFGGRQ